MEVRKELYIGGRWVEPETHGDIDVTDSRTEEVMGSVPRGGAPEVELRRPDNNQSTMWKHAWVNNVSQFETRWEGLRVTNGEDVVGGVHLNNSRVTCKFTDGVWT